MVHVGKEIDKDDSEMFYPRNKMDSNPPIKSKTTGSTLEDNEFFWTVLSFSSQVAYKEIWPESPGNLSGA